MQEKVVVVVHHHIAEGIKIILVSRYLQGVDEVFLLFIPLEYFLLVVSSLNNVIAGPEKFNSRPPTQNFHLLKGKEAPAAAPRQGAAAESPIFTGFAFRRPSRYVYIKQWW